MDKSQYDTLVRRSNFAIIKTCLVSTKKRLIKIGYLSYRDMLSNVRTKPPTPTQGAVSSTQILGNRISIVRADMGVRLLWENIDGFQIFQKIKQKIRSSSLPLGEG